MKKLLFLLFLTWQACSSPTEETGLPASGANPCDAASGEGLPAIVAALDTLPLDTALALADSLALLWMGCPNALADSLLALANDRLGRLLLGQSRFQEARKHFQYALHMRKRSFADPLDRDILRMYHNIGVTYFGLGDMHPAITYFDSAGVWTENGMPVPYVYSKLKTAEAYLELGELNKALAYGQLAYDSMLVHPIDANTRLELFRTLAACYRQLHDYGAGIERATSGIDPNAPALGLADLYLVLGNIWQDSMLQAGRTAAVLRQAVDYTGRALDAYRDIPWADIREQRITIAAGNLGELYRRAGQSDTARQTLSQAIASLRPQRGVSPLFAQLYINRGETFYDLKDYARALSDFDSAMYSLVPVYRPGIGSPLPPLSAPIVDRKDLILLLGDIALTHLTLFEKEQQAAALQKAVTVYDTLFNLINLVRGDFISDDAKLDLAASSQEVLRKATWGCLKLAEATGQAAYREQAFRNAEQSKAFTLLEAARLKNVSSRLPDSLRRQEADLLAERAAIEDEEVSAWNDPDAREKVEEKKLENFEKIRALQQKLKDDHASYFTLKYKGADLSVRDIQEGLLEKGQAIVEYFSQDSSLLIFVITPERFEVASFPIDEATLNAMVNEFRSLLERRETKDPDQEARFCRVAHELYRCLLAPVEGFLPERLIIIPTGPLNNLPFEALLARLSDGDIAAQARAEHFALFRHSFSYCFSANLLWEMQHKPRASGLARGPAVFAAGFHQDLHKGGGSEALLPSLRKAVPFLTALGRNQETEVDGITRKDFKGSCLYPPTEATKTNFLDACRRFSIVHAPTHGILNEEDPGLSFISFSQNSPQLDLAELLFVKDLYAEHLYADLVFFSACQTATGRYMAGEGNISMARGLAYAGVRSFITTLWNVPTAAKAEIAPDFYVRLLQDKQPRDVALAQAKRAAARQYHPSDWAGLILIGVTEPLNTPTSGKRPLWIALAATAAGGFILMRRRRKQG